MAQKSKIETMTWVNGVDGYLDMIDQTRLPNELVRIECRDVETVWEAIKMLRVRGAPAIGIAAAYGVVVGLQTASDSEEHFFDRLNQVVDYLATSHPTAVVSPFANGAPARPRRREFARGRVWHDG